MKKLILFGMLIALLGCDGGSHDYYPPAEGEVDAVTFGTAGEGATAELVEDYVELYTEHGGVGSAYVRLTLQNPMPLEDVESLSYEARLVSFGVNPPYTGTPVLEVVLNIDADDDGELEGTGLAWMTPGTSHDPAALGDDNFLSGDSWPFMEDADTEFVIRDALGDGYFYWCADDTRGTFGWFYSHFFTVLDDHLPAYDIDLTDKVYSIDFICGTSGNWVDTTIRVLSIELNGVVNQMPY